MGEQYDYDFIVIGSGFGGSVSAMRLSEKGYRVGVIEAGKRYHAKDFTKSNWNLKKFFWLPQMGLHGILKMTVFKHAFILSGVGVGGGSLGYACTLYVPPDKVWDDLRWAKLQDWKTVMPKYYEIAQKMLGVTTNLYIGKADKMLRAAAEAQGFGNTFQPTEVGIYFGKKDKTEPDPYFGGKGPERTGCNFCGGCMVGCRNNSKNTLDKNYLYFAEKNGAVIMPETTVTEIRPIYNTNGKDGYEIHTVSSLGQFKKKKKFRAKGVILAGGVLGTLPLLFENKQNGNLPKISDELGNYVRTNSEAILSLTLEDKDTDISDGIAIGSSIFIDEETHIEAVRYPKGSDALASIATLLPEQEGNHRFTDWLKEVKQHPLNLLRDLNPIGWAKHTVLLLVMQTKDVRLRIRYKKLSLLSKHKILVTEGAKVPATIPQANRFAQNMAKQFKGVLGTSLTEILLEVPTSAHILGGVTMGSRPEKGVIDMKCRVFNYKNLYVCDGSIVSANLGVNPSLTITALTEHAMSYIEEAKDRDWSK
ncbi:GMC family oxidoreductase [Deltaproteobacteria bacterium TL4]